MPIYFNSAVPERGHRGGGLPGVLGLRRFRIHADRRLKRTGAGDAGRLSGREEKDFRAVRYGRRVCAFWCLGSDILEGIFNPAHCSEGRLFRQSDLLRFDAFGYHDTGADGPRVLTHGYAWGYIGGCIPFVISLVFELFCEQFSMTIMTAMIRTFVINALWWLGARLAAC